MLAGAAGLPQWWSIWLAGLALNHGALCAASMWPRSQLLGPNITRLPAAAASAGQVCLTFDDGPDPQVTPLVLDMLARAGVHGSFFCIGNQIKKHPSLTREILAAGHSIENHTQTHDHRFAFRGSTGLHQEIAQAQANIEALGSPTPKFFRAPAGMRNPFLQTVLARLNLHLTSWTRRGFDTVEKRADRVTHRLTKSLAAGDLLLLHDGHAARTANDKPMVVEVLPEILRILQANNLKSVSLPTAFNMDKRLKT